MTPTRLLAALVLLGTGPALAQTAPVRVGSAWARATPPRAEVAAVYLTLTAPTADRLTGVETAEAASAAVHTMSMDGDVMRMREVPELPLPAQQAVVLGPGGPHIMLERLAAPLRAGQTIRLRLRFAVAPPAEVSVAVRGVSAPDPHARH